MIIYDGGKYPSYNMICRSQGSVVPNALLMASVPAAFGCLLNWLVFYSGLREEDMQAFVPTDNEFSVFVSFGWVIGFVLVFRTSQAYSRYWEGAQLIHTVTTEWFDACSQLTAFALTSGTQKEAVEGFCGTLVRLFSLLHCSALQQVTVMEDNTFETLDISGLDGHLLEFLKEFDSKETSQQEQREKTEIIFQWITNSVLTAVHHKVITTPPPIVSRAFQEMNSGLTALNRMMTITDTPFPFPYTQMILVLLSVSSFLTPIMVAAKASNPLWAFVLTLIPVFMQWTINLIAAEIEQPFGDDLNDFEFHKLQKELNASLIGLLDPRVQACPKFIPYVVEEKSPKAKSPQKSPSLKRQKTCFDSIQNSLKTLRLEDAADVELAFQQDVVAEEASGKEPTEPRPKSGELLTNETEDKSMASSLFLTKATDSRAEESSEFLLKRSKADNEEAKAQAAPLTLAAVSVSRDPGDTGDQELSWTDLGRRLEECASHMAELQHQGVMELALLRQSLESIKRLAEDRAMGFPGIPTGGAGAAAWTADGRTVVAAGSDVGGAPRVYNLEPAASVAHQERNSYCCYQERQTGRVEEVPISLREYPTYPHRFRAHV